MWDQRLSVEREREVSVSHVTPEWRKYANSILHKLSALRLPPGALDLWKEVCLNAEPPVSLTLLKKFEVPTQDQIDKWSEMEKGLSALQRIKLPILCGWTVEEVAKEIEPYIGDNTERYHTNRFDHQDCFQAGRVGVIKALRTDAGKSPFASHAYHHIRTNIRRNSVNSGLLHETERTPSVTEVKREIGAYLSTDWLGHRMDLLAQRYKDAPCRFTNLASIEEELKAVSNTPKADAKKIRKEIEAVARQEIKNLKAKMVRAGIKVNVINYTKPTDFAMQKVQKTGNSHATCMLIKGSYSLRRLDIEVVYDLFDYLDFRFNSDPEVHILRNYDSVKLASIADVIGAVAQSPEFHGNPVAIDLRADGEEIQKSEIQDINRWKEVRVEVPDKIAEGQELSSYYVKFISMIRDEVTLTNEQELVLCFHFGLSVRREEAECRRLAAAVNDEDPAIYEDGGWFHYRPKPVNGSWLADNFGKITGKKNISRQRVTQYLKAIKKKFLPKAFEILYGLERPDCKHFMERSMKLAGLTEGERNIASWVFGLFGLKEHTVEFVAENYDDIMETEPSSLPVEHKKEEVQKQLDNFKQKLCAVQL
jgi:hypothetical protein